jgi:hypothetical protein
MLILKVKREPADEVRRQAILPDNSQTHCGSAAFLAVRLCLTTKGKKSS